MLLIGFLLDGGWGSIYAAIFFAAAEKVGKTKRLVSLGKVLSGPIDGVLPRIRILGEQRLRVGGMR